MFKKILMFAGLALAHQMTLGAQTSQDNLPGLRTGKLSNGLTYYIYPSESNPGKMSLYLLQNIGGVVEQDKEQGMAHFMEHLSFNTSEHFPRGIMSYLLANPSLSFDAKTGINDTKYQIDNIPTNEKNLVDSTLLILRDWVEGIRITPETVEKERGIVLEEWRQRAGVDRRLTDSIAPAIYPASPYAYRNTIGKESTLRSFTPKALKAFREAWYRPELQAVIIIGDIKPEVYEARLKRLFTSKASKRPIQRPDIIIPSHSKPVYYRFVDKDNLGLSMGIYQRIYSPPTDKTRNYVAERLFFKIFNEVMSSRLSRLRNEGNELFVGQVVNAGPLVRAYDQITWDIVPYSGQGEAALKQALSLREQLRREGISAEEFEAKQMQILREIKILLEEKILDNPDNLMGLFKLNFLYGIPIRSLREELTTTYETLVEMEVDDVNQWLARTLNDDNLAFITYTNRDDELRIPLSAFERLLQEVKREPTFSFAAVKPIDQMIDFEIQPGKIVKQTQIQELDTKEWTLSNGARMLYKYIPDLKGEFYFVASSLGGRSAVKASDLPAFAAVKALIMRSGLGKYNRNDLSNWLQGKNLNLNISIEDYSEGISGNAPTEQAKNFFEYLYMVLTKQNFSATELEKYKDLQKYLYTSRMAQSRSQVEEQIKARLYPYSPLNPKEDIAFYEGIRHADVLRVYNERMLSAKDFTFCILGDLPEAEARLLTERYIASLPAGTLPGKETYKILDFEAQDEVINLVHTAELEGDVGEVELSYILAGKLNEREELALPVLRNVLETRMFEQLREREQGVYSVGVNLDYTPEPKATTRLNIHFSTERSKTERMKEEAYRVLQEVAGGKFSDASYKQALVSQALINQDQATTPEDNPLMWLMYLNAYVETGKIPSLKPKTTDSPLVESLDKGEIVALAKKILTRSKRRDIVLKSLESQSDRLH